MRRLVSVMLMLLLWTMANVGLKVAAQQEDPQNPAILHVSLPAGTYHDPHADPWLNDGWILNITGTSGTFTLRVNDTSGAITSYDTHLVIALNYHAYDNLVSLTVNGTTIPKDTFQSGTPTPYDIWTWPSGDVYPTWFNDTYVNLGTIPPKGYTDVPVSVTLSNATDARMHFDAYGSSISPPPCSPGQITHNPLSQDSTVLFLPEVLVPPYADFTWSPTSPQVCETVTFNASLSYDQDGTIVSYRWDFGDSNVTTVNEPIITHHYTAPATYTVNLTVTDNDCLTDSTSKDITVREHPVAAFTYSPLNPQVCEEVVFNASDSTPDGGCIISYEWDFGDCSPHEFGVIVTHCYAEPGDYTVTLNVTDSKGKSDTESKIVVVSAPPQPPHADFSWCPLSPQVCELVTFDGSASTPDGGCIISYEWDFGDCSHEFGVMVTHRYTSFGNYTVTLNVTDSEGLWDTESKTITVRKHPHADFTWSPSVPYTCQTVTFDGSASTPDGGHIVSYEWNFGDCFPHKYGMIVTHCFAAPGEYIVTLNVTDSENKWDIESKRITVITAPQPPKVDFTWCPLSPQVCEIVTFDASASTPDGGCIVSYEWDFGDCSPHGFGMIVTHHYTSFGNYTVTLNVTDSEGMWDTESKTIKVRAHPHAAFTYSPLDPHVGEEVVFDASDSTPNGGIIISYEWDFGDGNITAVTDPIVTHVYDSQCWHTVILNVTDSEGKWGTESKTIKVLAPPCAQPPHADFNWCPPLPQVCEIVTFDASASTPNGGYIVSYTWYFGDCNTTTVSCPIIAHHYKAPGNYMVTLNVTDSEGLWDTESKTVTVITAPQPPKAAFTYSPLCPHVCEEVVFNASDSRPDGGIIVSYEWNFGDGNITAVTDPIVTHVYNLAANYTVILNVTDSEGKWGTESKTIKVVQNPTALFTVTSPKPYMGQKVTFNASSSYDPDGYIVSYTWDFGDGNITTVIDPVITHNYVAAGTYDVTLTVIDSDGLNHSAKNNLTIRTLAGDLNGDERVDIRDITIVALAFGSEPGDKNWNPIADLNNDEVIDIRDVTLAVKEFGKRL